VAAGLTVFTEDVLGEWNKLSQSLHPGSTVMEKAKVLSFIIARCQILLTKLPGAPQDGLGICWVPSLFHYQAG
jgi:hypothetical protein